MRDRQCRSSIGKHMIASWSEPISALRNDPGSGHELGGNMKLGPATAVIAHLALAAIGISCAMFARAETLLDQNVMVSTSTAPKVDPLSLASTGKLSITVSDLQWPAALSSLSFTISNTTTVLAKWVGVGRLDFDVA